MNALTEDEAKKRWCPFARTLYVGKAGGIQPPSNRFSNPDGQENNPPDCRCIGSACMAWRWRLSGDGYCGLAGGIT